MSDALFYGLLAWESVVLVFAFIAVAQAQAWRKSAERLKALGIAGSRAVGALRGMIDAKFLPSPHDGFALEIIAEWERRMSELGKP